MNNTEVKEKLKDILEINWANYMCEVCHVLRMVGDEQHCKESTACFYWSQEAWFKTHVLTGCYYE